eukprot:TRINITY_DN40346_c0_g1_i1.p1 TRINITY_DN40346_c0_g1~~TRINITY_DN40346_c0_g1_i1.p1  ORF type:complete len:275 (+),score=75.45 TRINITY_DN40346_c0_g1_i1:44-868(+)
MASAFADKRVVLGVAAAATAAALLLARAAARPARRKRVTSEQALSALRLLRAEVAAFYADIVGSIGRAGLPRALAAAGASAKPSQAEDSSVLRMRQAIEQPLVLAAGLAEATARAAAAGLGPGATAADLEAELRRPRPENPEFERIATEVRAMHEACLQGRCAEASSPQEEAELWEPDLALSMLRELGTAKAACLRGVDAPSAALRACAKAEETVWRQRWPDDFAQRRLAFAPALERFAARDEDFRKRRRAVELELQDRAKANATTLRARVAAA